MKRREAEIILLSVVLILTMLACGLENIQIVESRQTLRQRLPHRLNYYNKVDRWYLAGAVVQNPPTIQVL